MPLNIPQSPWQGTVDTDVGPAFVKTVGQGPTVFVVHGGPGLDHGYLADGLSFLSASRTLVFYDQPGCGKTPSPEDGTTLESTAWHLSALIAAIAPEQNIGLIAHSWGTLVALAASGGEVNFMEGMLISPVPVTASEYGVCANNLLSRFSPETAAKAQEMMLAGEAGEKVMEMLLPYYVSNKECLDGFSVPFRYDTYAGVNATLGDFDFSGAVGAFSNLGVIRGENDFTTPDLIQGILGVVTTDFALPDVGHFPFIEDADSFQAMAQKIFS